MGSAKPSGLRCRMVTAFWKRLQGSRRLSMAPGGPHFESAPLRRLSTQALVMEFVNVLCRRTKPPGATRGHMSAMKSSRPEPTELPLPPPRAKAKSRKPSNQTKSKMHSPLYSSRNARASSKCRDSLDSNPKAVATSNKRLAVVPSCARLSTQCRVPPLLWLGKLSSTNQPSMLVSCCHSSQASASLALSSKAWRRNAEVYPAPISKQLLGFTKRVRL
mmetsp:Transcript_174376/g.558997  ORF Transcript_174376/g.558997 Transcript_174376/m.558997 type:complete len:218 (+) Transcript_174376:291-944(+)